jgi:glycosyltransferase involved in cell wall biosynthesis
MISVVVPFYNEEGSIKQLVTSLYSHLERIKRPFELILVDDGSTDSSLVRSQELLGLYAGLTLVSLRKNQGKSAALSVGLEQAGGDIVFTLDADLQDDPGDIQKFIEKLEEGFDLVCGWRKPRRDSAYKRLQSLLYNSALRVTGFRIVHDINCGFKAMRREVAREIPLSGQRHRLIPLVAAWQGFRVGEVVVNHKPRELGRSKYGASRLPNAVFDIFTALLLSHFYRRFISVVGALLVLAGIIMCGYVTYLKITTGSVQYHYPLLILGVMLLALGMQLVLAGFLSELVAFRRGRPSNEYSIKLIARSPDSQQHTPSGK